MVVEKYVPISKKDCETFKTVAFMSRIADKTEMFRETLRQMSEKENADIQSKLAYALFNMVAGNANSVLESKTNVENAIATFDEILEACPDMWIAKIFKIRIMLMLPCNFRDEEEIADEIQDVIQSQLTSDYQPYFVVTYLLMSELYWSLGEEDTAVNYLNQALEFKPGIITEIPDYLIIIFEELETKLNMSGHTQHADTVKKLKLQYFA